MKIGVYLQMHLARHVTNGPSPNYEWLTASSMEGSARKLTLGLAIESAPDKSKITWIDSTPRHHHRRSSYCFSCSPLQIPGSTLNSHRSSRFSPIMGLKDNAGIKEPSCSTPIGYAENAFKPEGPANASTTKSAMKESKIPKIPASRSGAHSLPKSNQNNVLSTSHSKHNQIGQTDIVQKSARIQDPFKNTKSSANKAKAGSDSSSLSAKSPLQHPRRNMHNSTLEVRLSTNPHPPLVTKANCGLEVFPAAVLPPTGSRAPDAHDLYRKTGVVPQNTHYIGGNMRDTQFQTIKPSGLRMPSPSLGFFCQPKSSASNSSSQKATQPSNIPKSYIPGLQRFNGSNYTHDPRLLHAPEKMPKMDNNATVSGNSRVSGSSTECSPPSAYSDASHENVELKIEGSNALTMETMLPCYPKSSELMKDNQQEHKIVGGDKGFQECGEPHKDDQNSFKEDSDFEMNYDDWLLQSRSSDQLKKDSNNEVAISCPEFIYSKMDELENSNFASQHSCAVLAKGVPEANDTIKHQHVENKQCFVIMHNDSSSDIHVDEWSTLKDELINASAGKANQIPHGENPNLVRNDRILLEDGKLFESQKYKRENDATVDSNICESNGSESLSSNSPPHESTEQANEGAAAVDQLNDKLHAKMDNEESSFSVKRIQTLANETNAMDIGVDKKNTILPDDNERRISQENVNLGELQHKLDDAICSSEESGFSVKRIQTLANETNAMDIGVDKRNSILPDDNELGISQENVNPGELQHKLDDAICSSEESEDEDRTMPFKKLEDDEKQNNPMINPTVNAVPFSDEWLAAMEAAGEKILTMKSGAVQNSPPDKSLPEPGPWSPVKRKQNSIGPFDCTKFVNIPPPNSD
ncbi:hypothetical protein LOK49_LG15G01543 [Camellia lanceoleosa]|uniref:Uncharacterized protein n=1 Tax=Camellia lanceoleosa TaxID=1840588 RepID=A0ACC0F7E1_9ERIC|nr:hypothetical protein LOK49_LG15G01543 [Camellia lanceoleosa]